MKVILLDFDGVLNDDAWIKDTKDKHPGVLRWAPEVGADLLDPVRCARVQRICDTTGASLLLVTGWRQWASPEVLGGLLKSKGLTAPVLGSVGGVKFSGDLRAQASHEWLANHREVTSYAILDDDPFYWSDKRWKEHKLAIQDGMEDEHVDQAIAILNKE
jgi:hypothetical protein